MRGPANFESHHTTVANKLTFEFTLWSTQMLAVLKPEGLEQATVVMLSQVGSMRVRWDPEEEPH
jgi:hypothetical protein